MCVKPGNIRICHGNLARGIDYGSRRLRTEGLLHVLLMETREQNTFFGHVNAYLQSQRHSGESTLELISKVAW